MRIDRAAPALAVAALVAAAAPAAAQDAARGAALLSEARTAVGGEDKLAAIKRLQLNGSFKRAQGNNTQEGDFDIEIEVPDKYKLHEDTSIPGGPSNERTQVLNGTDVWDENSGGGFPGGGGFRGFGGRDGGGGDFGRGGFGGGRRGGDQPAAGAAQGGRGQIDPERLREAQRRQRQIDLDHLLLVTLLTSNAPVTWVGTAQSPDGTADVLEFKPQEGAAMRLFLDPASHMPLMITWEGAARAGGAGGRGRFGRRGGDAGERGGDAAAARGADAPAAAPQATTLEMHLSNYKTVNGLRLPHFISRGANGQTQEEMTVKSYKLNPNFKSNTFIQAK